MAEMIPLILIPICALLNHWGGQSTLIPNPRIVCRVLGVAVAFYVIAALTHTFQWALGSASVVLVGMAIWAAPGWASGFCCIPPYHDGRQDTVLSGIVNSIMGVNSNITPAQAYKWGVVYFTLRGLYIYPLFAKLGYMLTPWAYLIGLAGVLQGIIYGNAKTVYNAEFIMGALIGAMLAATMMMA